MLTLINALYRRKHKKGTQEETVKKRTRRNVKFDRAIQGTTLEQILQKRNQTQDVRKAQREQLIRFALIYTPNAVISSYCVCCREP